MVIPRKAFRDPGVWTEKPEVPRVHIHPHIGGPNAENSTLINGFYETRPIIYGEEAICNVTDSKIIMLFVDDEPFWLPDANLLGYDRRLRFRKNRTDQ
jgi:alpha,alpha-trehalose phosphorylase